jgi:hypothetical protein
MRIKPTVIKSYKFIPKQLSHKIKKMILQWVGLPHWKKKTKQANWEPKERWMYLYSATISTSLS